jgi:hypothetical protein
VAAWRKLPALPEVEAALHLPCMFAWGQ